MKITINHYFDAQHQLPDTEFLVTKACHAYHGHTYRVLTTAEGKDLRGGMLVDFKGIKQLIDTLDHTAIYQKGNPMIAFLAEISPTQKVVILEDAPSSENIAKHIHQIIMAKYPFLEKLSVAVCEGYKGEERANWTTYEEN